MKSKNVFLMILFLFLLIGCKYDFVVTQLGADGKVVSCWSVEGARLDKFDGLLVWGKGNLDVRVSSPYNYAYVENKDWNSAYKVLNIQDPKLCN